MTTGGLLPSANSGGLIFSSNSGSLYFTSSAIDLTNNPPDTNAAQSSSFGGVPHNLFEFDLATGTTSLISATPDGQLSDGSNINAVLSPDGQTLYFASNANDLVPGGTTSPSPNIYAATLPVLTTPDQISFQSWETSADESAGQAVVTVQLSSPMTSAASVDYAVQPGTAQAGTDFTATSGTLNFAAGQTSQTFTVPLVASDHFAGTRSATLVLSNPQGATLALSVGHARLDLQPPGADGPALDSDEHHPRNIDEEDPSVADQHRNADDPDSDPHLPRPPWSRVPPS